MHTPAQTDKQTQAHTDRHRQTDTERETNRQRHRHRQTDTDKTHGHRRIHTESSEANVRPRNTLTILLGVVVWCMGWWLNVWQKKITQIVEPLCSKGYGLRHRSCMCPREKASRSLLEVKKPVKICIDLRLKKIPRLEQSYRKKKLHTVYQICACEKIRRRSSGVKNNIHDREGWPDTLVRKSKRQPERNNSAPTPSQSQEPTCVSISSRYRRRSARTPSSDLKPSLCRTSDNAACRRDMPPLPPPPLLPPPPPRPPSSPATFCQQCFRVVS